MSNTVNTEALIAIARHALADKRIETGTIVESRFQLYAETEPADAIASVQVLAENDMSITRRVSIRDGRKSSSALIAEYEEKALFASESSNDESQAAAAGEATVLSGDDTAGRELSTAQKRRRQIFEGACEVISRKGYGDSTVREIAKASGVSVPSLYQYVSSKEDILFMITEECMRELFAAFKRNMDTSMSPAEKMSQAIADYITYISRNRKYINLVYRETRSLSARYRDRIFDLERSLMGEWEQIFLDGREQGLFQDINPTLVANVAYFSCSVWALRHWAVGEYSEEEMRDALTRMLMEGVLSRT